MEFLPKLGLGPSPENLTFLFVGEAEGDEGPTPWYRWDHEHNKPIPVKDTALTGYIYNVTITKKTYKNKDNYKMDIHVNADRKYVIRAGAGTTFSRGFILSLEKLIDEAGNSVLEKPITISVSAADESKAMFCGIYHPTKGHKIIPDWDSEAQLFPKVNVLQSRLNQVVQTKEMIDDYELYQEAVRQHREEVTNESGSDKGSRVRSRSAAKNSH